MWKIHMGKIVHIEWKTPYLNGNTSLYSGNHVQSNQQNWKLGAEKCNELNEWEKKKACV